MECAKGRLTFDAPAALVPREFRGKVAAWRAAVPLLEADPDVALVTDRGLLVEAKGGRVLRKKVTDVKNVADLHLLTSRSGRRFYFVLGNEEGVAFRASDLQKHQSFPGVQSASVHDFWGSTGSEQVRLRFGGKPDLVTDFLPRAAGENVEPDPSVDRALAQQLQLSRKAFADASDKSQKLDELISSFFSSCSSEAGAEERSVEDLLIASLPPERTSRDGRPPEAEEAGQLLSVREAEAPRVDLALRRLVVLLRVENTSDSHSLRDLRVVPLAGSGDSFGFFVLRQNEGGSGSHESDEMFRVGGKGEGGGELFERGHFLPGQTAKLCLGMELDYFLRQRNIASLNLLFSFVREGEEEKGPRSQSYTVKMSDRLWLEEGRRKTEKGGAEAEAAAGMLSRGLRRCRRVAIKSNLKPPKEHQGLVTKLLEENCFLFQRPQTEEEVAFSSSDGGLFVTLSNEEKEGKEGEGDSVVTLDLFGPDVDVKLLLLRLRAALPQDADVNSIRASSAEEKDVGGREANALWDELAAAAKFARQVQRRALREALQADTVEAAARVQVPVAKYAAFREDLVRREAKTDELVMRRKKL